MGRRDSDERGNAARRLWSDGGSCDTWLATGGFIYLLAVNCTQKPQSVSLSLSEPVELVSSEFGAAPRVDNTTIGVDLTPIGYVMMKLKGNNAP